ncbi:sulfatase-like hydrolase/transferase [Candidatus Epulonipiscium viviparus]|uniref:sulfatase-like hydrolase/transferase n=1 Tax=Candidatus Epulonipiscium viviparus TaxID=420336 RepID=UPI0027381609|nr:sulfatase-like hydrolase/transferase [Candidatus Epulopiscium viviparus]
MKQPNIIFILTDDQGAWAMRCAGNHDVQTPNLDRLAANGVRFENFYCASPVCSAARASIVTGRMPSAHGIHDWLNGGSVDTAKYPNMSSHKSFAKPDTAIEYLDGQHTYIEELASHGYRCALSGKWHLGNNAHPKPGFEKWFALGHGGCNYYDADICENGEFYQSTEYVTDTITNRALDFLAEFKNDTRPFYLSVHYTAPHTPWTHSEHPAKFISQYDNCDFTSTPELPVHPNQINTCAIGDTPAKRRSCLTGYYAAITAMDHNVGKILDFLEANDLADNTVVMFTADNGMNLGQHGVWGKGNGTYPPNMYDSSVKVPFIISAPFIQNSNTVSSLTASHLDIFQTIMDIAGISYKSQPLQPGHSFFPHLVGSNQQHTNVFMFDEYGFVRMIRSDQFKLVYRYNDLDSELYDLAADADETTNLYGQPEYAQIQNDLTHKLNEWFSQYTDTKFDGHLLPLTGRGQFDWCFNSPAFTQDLKFFY